MRDITVRQHVPSVPAVLTALDRMQRELTSARTYKEIRKLIKEADFYERLLGDIDEVRLKAQEVIVEAKVRIGEELRKEVPKITGRPSKSRPAQGTTFQDDRTAAIKSRSTRSRLMKLADIPKPRRDAIKAHLIDDGKDVTETAILKIVAAEAKAKQRRDAYEAGLLGGCTIDDLYALIASGRRFKLIYADPPWPTDTWSEKGKDRSPDKHFRPMTIAEIKALPITDLADKDCVLFLWIVRHQLSAAHEVIKVWGFEERGWGFIWPKEYRNSDSAYMGLGYGTRTGAEVCLMAVKGSPLRLNMDVLEVIDEPEVIRAPVGGHSEKPEEVRRRIERLFPGPYLELFSRKKFVEYWVLWGNEVPREALLAATAAGEVLPTPPTASASRQQSSLADLGKLAQQRRGP